MIKYSIIIYMNDQRSILSVRVIYGVFVVAICLFLLTSCVGLQTEITTYNSQDSDDIYIGIAYPVALTDGDSLFREGFELAIQHINENGGVLGKTLHAVIRDDNDDVHSAMQIADAFFEQGITAVIGHWSTNVSYFVSAVYEKNGVVMVTPTATGMNLLEYDNRYVFRMFANHEVMSHALADHSADHNHRHVVIFFDDTEYGRDFATAMERELIRHNIAVVDRVSSITSFNIADISARWSAFGVDAVYIASSVENFVQPIKLIRDSNPDIPILSGDNFVGRSFDYQLEDYMDNIFKATYDIALLDSDFLQKFYDTYGRSPDVRAVAGYDSVQLLASAMEAVGGTDATAIAAYISSISGYPAVSGALTFDRYSGEFEGFRVIVRQINTNGDIKDE